MTERNDKRARNPKEKEDREQNGNWVARIDDITSTLFFFKMNHSSITKTILSLFYFKSLVIVCVNFSRISQFSMAPSFFFEFILRKYSNFFIVVSRVLRTLTRTQNHALALCSINRCQCRCVLLIFAYIGEIYVNDVVVVSLFSVVSFRSAVSRRRVRVYQKYNYFFHCFFWLLIPFCVDRSRS